MKRLVEAPFSLEFQYMIAMLILIAFGADPLCSQVFHNPSSSPMEAIQTGATEVMGPVGLTAANPATTLQPFGEIPSEEGPCDHQGTY